jgi:hypothetical protein
MVFNTTFNNISVVSWLPVLFMDETVIPWENHWPDASHCHHLKRRGYNDKVIESGFSKASEINRNNLLEYKEKKINKRVPLVLTYHPSLEKISGIVRHHWKEIDKNETLAKLFPEPPVVAFRRPTVKALRIHWSELRYLDLHRRSASVNHVVTSVASAVSNCNTHKRSIVRR